METSTGSENGQFLEQTTIYAVAARLFYRFRNFNVMYSDSIRVLSDDSFDDIRRCTDNVTKVHPGYSLENILLYFWKNDDPEPAQTSFIPLLAGSDFSLSEIQKVIEKFDYSEEALEILENTLVYQRTPKQWFNTTEEQLTERHHKIWKYDILSKRLRDVTSEEFTEFLQMEISLYNAWINGGDITLPEDWDGFRSHPTLRKVIAEGTIPGTLTDDYIDILYKDIDLSTIEVVDLVATQHKKDTNENAKLVYTVFWGMDIVKSHEQFFKGVVNKLLGIE